MTSLPRELPTPAKHGVGEWERLLILRFPRHGERETHATGSAPDGLLTRQCQSLPLHALSSVYLGPRNLEKYGKGQLKETPIQLVAFAKALAHPLHFT